MSGAKRLAVLGARLLALPLWAMWKLESLVLDPDRALHDASQAASLWPGLLGDYVRRELYRAALEACSDDCCLSFGTVFSKRGARIGRRAYVGTHCNLGLVTLEDDVLLASHVDVLSGAAQHRFDRLDVPVREQGGTVQRVTIGRDAWIGERSIVMADVGAQCVVGAGSIVTKPLPPRAIAVGAPAKVVGWRGGAPPEGSVA